MKRNKRISGAAIAPVVLIVAGVAVFAVGAGVGFYVRGLLNGGGGLGDGEVIGMEDSVPEEAVTAESLPEVTAPEVTETTEPPTQPPTQNFTSLEIVVTGNAYRCNGQTMGSVEEIRAVLEWVDADLCIKVTDERASLKAYRALTDLLKEMGRDYIT